MAKSLTVFNIFSQFCLFQTEKECLSHGIVEYEYQIQPRVGGIFLRKPSLNPYFKKSIRTVFFATFLIFY